jgi:preprotein translocase subunit SecD/SecD/SecF fusion protein
MDLKQRNVLLLTVTLVLVAASLWLLLPPVGPDFLEIQPAVVATATQTATQEVPLKQDKMELDRFGAPLGTSIERKSEDSWELITTVAGKQVKTPMQFDRAYETSSVLIRLNQGRPKITQGLDIRGGLSVILTAESSQTVSAQDMERAELIVRNRIDRLGVKETSVQRQGNDSILVQIPGVKDAGEALKLLGSTGQLEFVEVAAIKDPAVVSILQGGPDANGIYRDAQGNPLTLKPGTYKPFMTGEVITQANVGQDQLGKIVVNLAMNQEGIKTWAAETTRLYATRGQIAIVLDGVVRSAPAVQSAITDGRTEISGGFTPETAKQLKTVLETGALPVSLVFSESRVVGPTLGQDSLRRGVTALAVGLVLVALYMLIIYRGLGTIAVAALVVFAAMFLGILAVLSRFGFFSLTLPGIAGVVLTVGMAADSSVLILERFKEEVRLGKTIRSAADSGTWHGAMTSVDADLVTAVSGLALYAVAIGPVRGFAFTLILGVMCDFAMMLMFKRPLIMILAASVFAKAPGFWGVAERKDIQPPANKKKGGVANA